MPEERPLDEPFVSWMKREWLLVAITLGVALDWLPWVLTPFVPDAGILSGTRLLVLPALVLFTIARPGWIARPHVLGVAYLVAIFIGGGLGWLTGTVALGRLTAIVVNGFVLIYFLRIRSFESIRRVLAIVFVCSLLVPLIQVLAKVGVIPAAALEALGVDIAHSGGRVFSIFDSTTVGFVPLIIPAALGGLLFVSPRHRTMTAGLIAAVLVIFGLTSAVVAEQRSGVLAYGLSLMAAVMFFVASSRKSLARLAVIAALVIAALGGAYLLRGMASGAQKRFSDTGALESAQNLRLGGATTFISDLASDPLNPVPIGHQSLLDRTGVEPHLLLSEAYYDGGPIFLVVIIVILVKFGGACLSLAQSTETEARLIGHILCAFSAGAIVQVTLQTALGLRLVPLVIGLGIAASRSMRAEARVA